MLNNSDLMKTFDDYIKAVKLQYELKKNGEYGGFLLQPSPAQLRNLCLMIYDKGLLKLDEEQFSNFFQPKENEDLRKCILNFDVEKFKPIGLFFKGKSETTNLTNLELIAVLVAFPQRPLKKFLRSDIPLTEIIQEDGEDFKGEDTDLNKPVTTKTTAKRNKLALIALVVVTFLSVGYVAKDNYFPTKQCMQWQEDHYQIVDCKVNGFASISPVVALDEDVVELKKVTLKKGMEFFKYKKPLYYYYKVNKDSVEFFNAPGLHPITQEPLRKITWHMIHKYVDGREISNKSTN